MTVGLFLGLVGAVVMVGERRGRGAPDGFAVALVVTGLWGVVLSPVSGFWAFFPIAWLAHRTRGRRRLPRLRIGEGVVDEVDGGVGDPAVLRDAHARLDRHSPVQAVRCVVAREFARAATSNLSPEEQDQLAELLRKALGQSPASG